MGMGHTWILDSMSSYCMRDSLFSVLGSGLLARYWFYEVMGWKVVGVGIRTVDELRLML